MLGGAMNKLDSIQSYILFIPIAKQNSTLAFQAKKLRWNNVLILLNLASDNGSILLSCCELMKVHVVLNL
jgi:hypothetical protein